ncbi:hypothetical protein EDB19DRAFT_162032 [Suillus lakei]|nr:hypothetical protein EDB19DRAFT_162032 [Suillus lakei]
MVCARKPVFLLLEQIPMEYSTDDITTGRNLQSLAYMCTALVTFWTYDYACSLHEEWTFLLRSRWTKIKGLYIIARYAPFFPITVYLWLSLAPDVNHNKCQTLNNISACFAVIGFTCSECFFILRTYVLWNNNRIVLVSMMSFLFAIIVASIGISFTANADSNITTSAIPSIPGCYWSSDSFLFFMPFVLLFVFALVLVILTLIRVIHSWRLAKGHLHAVLVKHNIFYYACGLLLSAVNVLLPILASNYIYYNLLEQYVPPTFVADSMTDLKTCIYSLQVFILAILATRMHLHLWHIDQLVYVSEAVDCTV